ncbi:hypothetical protein QUF50_03580, partial [Thiotrichales bacterium HSG1]|nr:hypothetical protein [Thiotrichales bacterium HSG1]
MKYCFICICQEGELEIQSLLLMASLKRHLKVNYELYVAIPTPESIWGKPATDTLRQLNAFGVKFFYTTNEISNSYPIANKLGCFKVPTDADRIVFLDTDMILLRDFVDDPIFQNPLCIRAASLPLLEDDIENWKNIYRVANIDFPKTRISSVVSKEKMLPYYNAGFIAVDSFLDFSN